MENCTKYQIFNKVTELTRINLPCSEHVAKQAWVEMSSEVWSQTGLNIRNALYTNYKRFIQQLQ